MSIGFFDVKCDIYNSLMIAINDSSISVNNIEFADCFPGKLDSLNSNTSYIFYTHAPYQDYIKQITNISNVVMIGFNYKVSDNDECYILDIWIETIGIDDNLRRKIHHKINEKMIAIGYKQKEYADNLTHSLYFHIRDTAMIKDIIIEGLKEQPQTFTEIHSASELQVLTENELLTHLNELHQMGVIDIEEEVKQEIPKREGKPGCDRPAQILTTKQRIYKINSKYF